MDLKEIDLKQKQIKKVQECPSPRTLYNYIRCTHKLLIPHFAACGAQNNVRHVPSHICIRKNGIMAFATIRT